MKKYTRLQALVTALLLSFSLNACSWEDVKSWITEGGSSSTDDSYYRFKVESLGGPFSGWYIVDGGATVYITSLTTFSQNLNNPNSLSVVAVGDTTATSVIHIYIYENDEMVKHESDTVTAVGDYASISVDYDFVTEETTTTNPSVKAPPFTAPAPSLPMDEQPLDNSIIKPKTPEEIDRELIEQNKDLILF